MKLKIGTDGLWGLLSNLRLRLLKIRSGSCPARRCKIYGLPENLDLGGNSCSQPLGQILENGCASGWFEGAGLFIKGLPRVRTAYGNDSATLSRKSRPQPFTTPKFFVLFIKVDTPKLAQSLCA